MFTYKNACYGVYYSNASQFPLTLGTFNRTILVTISTTNNLTYLTNFFSGLTLCTAWCGLPESGVYCYNEPFADDSFFVRNFDNCATVSKKL